MSRLLKFLMFILVLEILFIYAVGLHAATITTHIIPSPGKGHAEVPQVLQPLWIVDTAEVDKPYYALTDAERTLIEQIVMAEAGNQGLHGQMLVTQCILTACQEDDIRPPEAIERYQYTKPHPEPTDSVKEAVAAVFDKGELPSAEPIKYFYSTKYCDGRWHETQIFVIEHLDHRFFAERRDAD